MPRLTPVMQQHAAAKSAHPHSVIFFRLGDFYEMFGDDAVLVSRELDLTLTSRNKGKPDEVPMAGVPHHAAHGYIARLLKKGHEVAVCEQMADPSTVKGIVPREVVRVITPGTWSDTPDLDEGENQWLCALHSKEGRLGIALFDLTTAELMAAELDDLSAALSELGRARPREILVGWEDSGIDEAENAEQKTQELVAEVKALFPEPAIHADSLISEEDIQQELLKLDSPHAGPLALSAAARVMRFARRCYRGDAPPVWRLSLWNPSGVLAIDRTAQAHLELVHSLSGEKGSSLLSVIDRSQSPPGARLMRRRLLAPLLNEAEINERLDQVAFFMEEQGVRHDIRVALGGLGDLERLAVRASMRELTPRDLGAIRRSLGAAQDVLTRLEASPEFSSQSWGELPEDCSALREKLALALVERPPAQLKEGAVFRQGFDGELDDSGELKEKGGEKITEFEAELRGTTGIPNLRVKYNRVFGWFVEVGKANLGKVPEHFRRKQTIANGERYTIDELDELAETLLHAEDRFRARELELLKDLSEEAQSWGARVHLLCAFLAQLDVAAALAELAVEADYCRPKVHRGLELKLVESRHPVVESQAARGRFVPNDLELEAKKNHLWLISGPNMAGKSTFLRQVALTVILAQMGSFVPAREAEIGLVDRVLSRVGASDNLAAGESTFMVEMRETSDILRTATSRSLVILDEVGRGTSTYDGLAIAWAVAEHLDQAIRCRALFATHYHELVELGESSESAENHSVSAKEHDGQVVFLHRVKPGGASRSYGVQVAQLAGLPESVLARARALLLSFEEKAAVRSAASKAKQPQLDLFHAPQDSRLSEVASTLKALDIDRLSGIEALQLLQVLKS
ncbi:MAG: DNA mismatch repair protein MutS, partial [Polyangiaceae bacterium]|nr:DNA mismatch repair protein MutS [Polyangiaceae bacterium]